MPKKQTHNKKFLISKTNNKGDLVVEFYKKEFTTLIKLTRLKENSGTESEDQLEMNIEFFVLLTEGRINLCRDIIVSQYSNLRILRRIGNLFEERIIIFNDELEELKIIIKEI